MKVREKDFLHLGNVPVGPQELGRDSFTAVNDE